MSSFKEKINTLLTRSGAKINLALFIVMLVLLNLVASKTFFRIDLTSQGSYKLSQASRELVASLEEPVAIRVYFTKNLPSPYNGVESYLKDLLSEYQGQSKSKKFNYTFLDMEESENRTQAMEFGLQNVQIQEVKDTEVGLKTAWMGLVILYGDSVEVVDNLSTTEGLEYKITTNIARMIALNDTLAGLEGSINLKLYASSALKQFGISGFNELPNELNAALQTLNARNRNRIVFSTIDPSELELDDIVAQYGLQKINWTDSRDPTSSGAGILGLVLSYKDRAIEIPLELVRGIFGGYSIRGMDNFENTIGDALQSLLSKSVEIAYITGHEEQSLWDSQYGAYNMQALVKDRYSFIEYEAITEVPSTVHTMVLNGPKTRLSDAELYALDQFVVRGGNLVLFVDPVNEILPDQQMMFYGVQPSYEVVDTGLETLFESWGVQFSTSYVMDKESYTARQQGVGEVPLYYVPLLPKEGLNQKHIVSKNLAYVLFLQAGEIREAKLGVQDGLVLTSLAHSSKDAWVPEEITDLNPFTIMPPYAKEDMRERTLALSLEGKFKSAYSGPIETSIKIEDTDYLTTETEGTFSVEDATSLSAISYMKEAVQNSRMVIFGSSSITTPQVLDAQGSQPIAILMRNAIDWVSGNEDLIPLRTKGLSLNTLDKTTKATRDTIRAINLYFLPAIAVALGVIIWRKRENRRKRIQAYWMGNSDGKATQDTDTTSNESEGGSL